MPWKVEGVVEQRLRFIMEREKAEFGVAELCRQHQITRQTAYKWIERYEAEGVGGLQDRSRAPQLHPNQVPDTVEEQVLAMRARYGTWGARKIRGALRNGGLEARPGRSTH